MNFKFAFVSFVSVLILLISSRCSEENNPVIPPEPGSSIILYSSFEENGNSSLAGWNFNLDSSLIAFTNDTPPEGGNWAVTIKSAWLIPGVNGLYTTVKIPEGTHIYKLSLWGKHESIVGSASLLLVKPDTTIFNFSIQITDTLWKEYTMTDTITAGAGDSLKVNLFGGGSQLLTGTTYFDLCKLELLE